MKLPWGRAAGNLRGESGLYFLMHVFAIQRKSSLIDVNAVMCTHFLCRFLKAFFLMDKNERPLCVKVNTKSVGR